MPGRSESRSAHRAGSAAARGSARTTTSTPAGVPQHERAARCRSRRLTRLRVTAFPTRSTDHEADARDASARARQPAWTTAWADSLVRPAWSSAGSPPSCAFSSNRGNTVVVQARCQADSSARPLRRRAARMARPARVRIRRRKPWVRLRRRLLGWNVRLLTGELPHLQGARRSGYGAHAARIAGGTGSGQRSRKRPSNGTGRRQTGQTDANSGGLRNSRRRCPVDTPNIYGEYRGRACMRLRDC